MHRISPSHPLLTMALMALLVSGTPAFWLAQQTNPSPPSQQPAKPVPPATQEPEAVVRISTRLVQIDAVVTDRRGEHVDDLTEADFELLLDGKRQTISHFSLVKLPEVKREARGGPKPNVPGAPGPAGMPTRPVAPEQVKRTVAFVIDDLGLSFSSTHFARQALKKFVDEQMQEGDLVGIIRTGRGLGALQQFTSDRRVLYAAIERLTWNPVSRNMLPRFGNAEGLPAGASAEAREAAAAFEDFRETVFSVGTLGALNFVVRGLRELPGRKSVILISDGFRLFGRNRDNDQVLQRVRRLVDLANRSSVVIYSLDARGLQTLFPTAADNLSGLSPQQLAEQLQRASQEQFESQDGLVYVARETGGFAVLNNNDLNLGVQRALRDGRSYYLLGFDPDDQQFDRRYHAIKVRVKRPGLQVRTRAGFFGVPEVAARPRPATRNEQILSALFSPFGARDLRLQMTSFFFHAEPAGSFVRSLFHIDCSNLTFQDAENGGKTLTLDLAAFTFNELGQVIDQHGRTFTLRFNEAHYRLALARGLVCTADVLIKKPGAYQFRAVLRDSETGRLGSASQFIQVPDLSRGRLALSGLFLSGPAAGPSGASGGPDPAGAQATAANQQPAASGKASTQASADDPQPTPAVRRFAQSSEIIYGAMIYNPALDQRSGRPQLSFQIEIYRDGKPLYQPPARAVDAAGLTHLKRLECGGQLKLTGFPPGDYLLRLVVTDALAQPKYARAEQWMDFSVR